MKWPILLVDMDKTLTKSTAWNPEQCLKARPNKVVIRVVNELAKKSFVVIYTARPDECIPNTLKWLRKHEVHFHAISNNKVPGHLYIDDKAMRPEELWCADKTRG